MRRALTPNDDLFKVLRLEVWRPDDGGCLKRFRQSRKGFKQIDSAKYDRGYVETEEP